MTTQTPERAEWLEQRRGYLGGTDVSAILGLHPYRTPLQVYLEKTGQALEQEETPAMRRGTRMEPYVAELYAEETGLTLRKGRPIIHREKPFLGVNPDYYAVDEENEALHVVELKTHNPFTSDNYGDPGTDQIPHHELIQCTWQMHLDDLGVDLCDLAVLFGLDDFRIYHVPYSEVLGAEIEDFATRWWRDHIEDRTPPAIGGSEPDTEWLKRRFPASTEAVAYATPEIEEICLRLADARREHKQAEEVKVAFENQIKAFMGDAGILEWSGGKPFTWKSTKPSEVVDWKAVAQELAQKTGGFAYGEAIARNTTTKPGVRRFLTPFKGE